MDTRMHLAAKEKRFQLVSDDEPNDWIAGSWPIHSYMIDYLKQMYGTICLIGSVALKLRAKGKQFRTIDATKMQLRLAGNEVNINQCRNIAAHFRVKFSIPSSQLFLTSDFIHSSNKAADSAPDEKLVWKLGAVSYKECKPSDSVSNTKYDNQSKFIPFPRWT